MKVSEIIANANPQPVSRGRNLSTIGWWDGYLLVMYHRPPKNGPPPKYIFGPKIAEVERDKLLRSTYPDHLFTQLRDKHGWQSFKVEVKRDTV